MSPHRRKLVATALLLSGLVGYVLGAVVLADHLPRHWLVSLSYFFIAGTGWSFPAMALLRWADGAPRSPASKPTETLP